MWLLWKTDIWYIWLVDCLEILSPHPPELGGQSDNSLLTNHKPIGAPETCHPIDSCYWNGVFIQWQYTIHSTTKRRCLKSSSTENDKPTRHHFLSNLLVTCIFFFHFPIPSYFFNHFSALINCWTFGIRVEPPTKTISSTFKGQSMTRLKWKGELPIVSRIWSGLRNLSFQVWKSTGTTCHTQDVGK